MIEVRLYGVLRHYAENKEVTGESIVYVPLEGQDTVQDVLKRIGIEPQEVSNIFINGTYASTALKSRVQDGDRLGVFPRNMGLLYI
ncbi:MAG: MoaD/ThiS family protein [Anaerolineae bacterium]